MEKSQKIVLFFLNSVDFIYCLPRSAIYSLIGLLVRFGQGE